MRARLRPSRLRAAARLAGTVLRSAAGPFYRQAQRTTRRLMRIPAFVLMYRTIRELSRDDATHMAAGVAYYSILSLFPLMVGLIAVLSPLLESDTVRKELLTFFQTYLPGSTETLDTNVDYAVGLRGALGLLSVIGMFWTASAIFGAISRAVNRAWDVHQDRPFYIDKLRHMAMALSVGMLFLMSFSATTALQFFDSIDIPGLGRPGVLENNVVSSGARLLPFLFSLTIFLMIYKFIPNTKTYWRYIWPGALLAAVCFEVGKSLFVYYVDNFADYEQLYGSLGSVVVLLVWTYASSFILITGAEFSSEYGRMREGVKQGELIEERKRPGRAT